MKPQERMRLQNLVNQEQKIHHWKPEEIYHAPVPKETPIKDDYKSQEFVGKFSKWVDNKDIDDKIDSGILDKAMNIQTEGENDQLPTTADVGKRNLGAPKQGTAFYPGFRGFYNHENANDFSQLNQYDPPDVGQRTATAPRHTTNFYPGTRRWYPYESYNDHA